MSIFNYSPSRRPQRTIITPDMDPSLVFVFGSNYDGYHGAGAARTAAEQWGALFGPRGMAGHHGRSYAIPTVGHRFAPIPTAYIIPYVDTFKFYAKVHQEFKFIVTQVGCGLARIHDDETMARMFLGSSKNCFFDTAWQQWLGDDYEYWGTF